MGRDARALGAFSLVASLLAAGCSGDKLSDTPAPDGSSAAGLAAYVGAWDGYAEAVAFTPDGSDHVRLVVDGSGNVTVTIGNEPPLPAPTDPNVGYPPAGVPNDLSGFWEGFGYPGHAVQVSSNRIQLGLNPADIYAAWCPLQTSYPLYQVSVDDGGTATAYGCVQHGVSFGFTSGVVPGADGGIDGGRDCAIVNGDAAAQAIDCGKLQLCTVGGACTCDATGCKSLNPFPPSLAAAGYPGSLDANVDGTTLTGTLALPGDGRLTIHLTRTPAP